jgi:hypothetical protein
MKTMHLQKKLLLSLKENEAHAFIKKEPFIISTSETLACHPTSCKSGIESLDLSMIGLNQNEVIDDMYKHFTKRNVMKPLMGYLNISDELLEKDSQVLEDEDNSISEGSTSCLDLYDCEAELDLNCPVMKA